MNGFPPIKQLPNGLRYVVAPQPGMKSATCLVLVKAGTRYETVDTNGISHFLEHMVFKGTQAMPTALDIAMTVDNVGGSFNAFTGKEYTGFYVKAAVSQLDLAMHVVSQLIFSPLIPAQELEIERGVILEEIRMYKDEPQAKVAQLFEQVMFAPTSLGWDILGTEETIKNIKQEAFLEYMNYLYVPNRMALVIAGGVEESEALEEKILQYFGKEKQLTELQTKRYTFDQTMPAVKRIAKKTEQCHLVYGFRTFGRGNRDRYVLSVLATILGGGMSSRLFTEIREKRGLAYYVGSMVDIYAESGYLAMRSGTKPESAQEVINVTNEEYEKLRTNPVGDKELTKAKEFIKGHLLLGWENSYEVADFYAEDLLLEGKLRSLDEVLAGIDAVSAKDIKRLAQTLFVEQGKNFAVIGPEKSVKTLTVASSESSSVTTPVSFRAHVL